MVVDTSAVVAILLGESEAASFESLIAGADETVISAASYVELVLVALGRGLAGRAELEQMLTDAAMTILPVTVAQAKLAADAFARFGKGRHPAGLNYGDCFAYALAKERGEPLLFKGEDFARTDIARAR